MPWATTAQVHTFTGATVTADELERAQVVWELFVGVTEDASDQGLISGRNMRLLVLGLCYQAAFMQQHPDYFTHMDADSLSQDGASVTPGSENARLLAPLAIRCLRRLSWKSSPLRALTRTGQNTDRGNRDSAVRDDQFDWTPMP